ncbi:MAG: hypothetical protein H0W84_04770 [Bacteroidetes bacterium]|nr:hypothetical protein [Bacteroidota bacterium]
MKYVSLLIFLCVAACNMDNRETSNVRVDNVNIIPWDTFGHTVEGKKINWFDVKTPAFIENDSIVRLIILEKINKAKLKEVFDRYHISVFAKVDTLDLPNSINLSVSRYDLNPIDSIDYKTLEKYILSVVREKGIWKAGRDYYNNKITALGLFRIKDKMLGI